MELRPLLEALEHLAGDERAAALAFLAAGSVSIDADELLAARRRALLLLAAGGDPRRALELDGGAVRSLAEDLDAPGRRAELAGALAGLRARSDGLPSVHDDLERLLADPGLAWRRLAGALLAEELAEGSPSDPHPSRE